MIFGVVNGLLEILYKNKYSFENEPGSYFGYLIVMFIVFCVIIIILFYIFRFIKEFLEEYIGTALSASISISIIIEGLGSIFKVVTLEIFSIIAEFVALTIMFFIIYLIVSNFIPDEPEPRRGR